MRIIYTMILVLIHINVSSQNIYVNYENTFNEKTLNEQIIHLKSYELGEKSDIKIELIHVKNLSTGENESYIKLNHDHYNGRFVTRLNIHEIDSIITTYETAFRTYLTEEDKAVFCYTSSEGSEFGAFNKGDGWKPFISFGNAPIGYQKDIKTKDIKAILNILQEAKSNDKSHKEN